MSGEPTVTTAPDPIGVEQPASMVDAVNALAARQTRTIHRTLRAWAVLVVLSVLAFSAFLALWWVENDVPFGWCFPITSGCFRGGCACFFYWGARTMVLPWLLAATLPCLLVPLRAPDAAVDMTRGATPYRADGRATAASPDGANGLHWRRARRALIASATAAGLVACACLDPFLTFPVDPGGSTLFRVPKVNGVAVLDLVIAAAVVLAYRRAARASR